MLMSKQNLKTLKHANDETFLFVIFSLSKKSEIFIRIAFDSSNDKLM